MLKLFKQNSFRWSALGMMVLIVLVGSLLTNGKTSAGTSDPQRVLKSFLDSAIEGNVDKALSYVTANGISNSELREKFKSDFSQEKLLSYKINKMFNDDATHASASITIKSVNEGEQRAVNKLIMQNGEWKIYMGNYASSTDSDKPLNEIDNRASLAEAYEAQENINEGKVQYAQPSIQLTVK
jgi:hypothetical protein